MLWLVMLSHGHFLWLKTTPNRSVAVVTFGENGTPGAADLLDDVQNQTRLSIQPVASTSSPLVLSRLPTPGNNCTGGDFKKDDPCAELVATFTAAPPYVLSLNSTFGIFPSMEPPHPLQPSLLQYYSNADQPTKPNDWFAIQAAEENAFDITIRDPYMTSNTSTDQRWWAAHGRSASVSMPGDQCPAGHATYNGSACVVAVVRFKGALMGGVAINTFAADGKALATTSSPSGVSILAVPLEPGGLTFAQVNHKEVVSGTYKGKKYECIEHWATTSATLRRARGAIGITVTQ